MIEKMGKADDGYFLPCLTSELKKVQSDENSVELKSSTYSSGLGRAVYYLHTSLSCTQLSIPFLRSA